MTLSIKSDRLVDRAVISTSTRGCSRCSPVAYALFCLLVTAFLSFPAALAAYGQQVPSSSPAAEASMPASAATSTPMATQAMLYPGDDFHLGSGDLISVRVFLQLDYQATVRVDADGNVQLPFIGSVNLKGLSVREAEALIAGRLESEGFYKNPEVIIQVLDTVNGSVLVTGEMHMIVPVSSERSLKDVLLTAGGLPPNASHTVKIVRVGVPDPIVVELGTDLASSKTANIELHPHDIIQISRASVVYVIGAFAHQGAVPLDQASPLTLLQLAALSGGIGFEGRFNDLRLIRTVQSEDGSVTRKLVQVDIKKVRDGKANDPVLQANDIVFLPTDPMKAIIKNLGSGGVLGIVSLIISTRGY